MRNLAEIYKDIEENEKQSKAEVEVFGSVDGPTLGDTIKLKNELDETLRQSKIIVKTIIPGEEFFEVSGTQGCGKTSFIMGSNRGKVVKDVIFSQDFVYPFISPSLIDGPEVLLFKESEITPRLKGLCLTILTKNTINIDGVVYNCTVNKIYVETQT